MAAPGEPQPQYPGIKSIIMTHWKKVSTFLTKRGQCLVMGHMMGCRGRTSWDEAVVMEFQAGSKDEKGGI